MNSKDGIRQKKRKEEERGEREIREREDDTKRKRKKRNSVGRFQDAATNTIPTYILNA